MAKLHKPNPCKDCVAPKRHPGCHSTCKARSEWKEEVDQAKKEIREEKNKDINLRNFSIVGIEKANKKRRGK